MIQIDKINNRDYWYNFPTIDFKFQNTGHATAFLWQFSIEVIHAEIDPKPELEFRAKVTDGALEVEVVNNGWGAALDCQIQIDEDTLNQLFDERARQFSGAIKSGGRKQIFRLTRDMADASQFEAISKKFLPLNKREVEFYSYFPESKKQKELIYGVDLPWVKATWDCTDERGERHQGTESIWSLFSETQIALTSSGFVSYWRGSGIHEMRMPSYVTYIAIIDPSKKSHEREYPISRKIPPGDVERFHIMVGSPASCHLRIKFKFFVDKHGVVESEEFDIHVWNPKNSGWHKDYADGAELSRVANGTFDILSYSR